jgi:autotransporter-associated beta strand protein
VPNGTWALTGAAGNWSASGSWVGGTIATGAGSTANLTSNITAIYSVLVPAGYAVTIGNIVFSDGGVDSFARYVQGDGTSNANTGGTLTLDSGGATQPVINLIQAAYINIQTTRSRFVLAGTNGFEKTGAQSLFIGQANGAGHTISGTIRVTQGSLYLGIAGSSVSVTNALPAATEFVVNGGAIYLAGPGDYTETKPFSCGATPSTVGNYASGQITFNNTAWRTFTGYAQVICDATSGTTVTSNFLTHFPIATIGILGQSNVSNSTATMIFSHDYAVMYPGAVGLYASAATTGGKFVLQDNGTASTNYQGTAYRLEGSNTSSSMALELSGANTACTYSGRIRNNEGTAAGSLLLSKAGAGKWVLTGDNTYTGTTTVSAGTLSAQSSSALGPDSSGSGGAISVTGGTLELAGGITVDKSGLNISTVTTASPTNAFQVPASGGDNTLEVGSITLNSTIRTEVGSSGVLRLANTGAISGSTFGITKEGAGELDLNAASNTFTGAVAVNAGTLTVSASCAPSTNGPLGNASSAVVVTGTLKFDGSSNSDITRSVQLTGSAPALDASGSHRVHFHNVSQASGTRTLTLRGTSTNNNQLQSALGNGSGGTLSLTKEGAGQWLVTGTPSYTGATTVNAGTLDFGGQTLSLSGGVAIAGGTLANGSIGDTLVSAVTFTGGTVIALLDSTSTVTASSGTGRLQPLTADGSNSYNGNTTVQSGATLELVTDANPGTVGDGKVTGASNVTVTGTLATGNGVNQRGQCRYGGNLTFAAGSVLAIGAAA